MLLDERKKKILEAVIEEYNRTAEPVGSNKLASDYNLGLSSATIRNEMASLEELGYLDKPHTSAGRVPSSKGYRVYVDSIMNEKNLPIQKKKLIDKAINEDLHQFRSLMQEASNILARLTDYASIAIEPELDNAEVEEIKLVKLGHDKLMIVILANNGIIKESVITDKEDIPEQNIEIFNNYLNYKLQGRNFREIYDNVNEYVGQELENINDKIVPLFAELNNLLINKNAKVHMEGATKLLEQPELKKQDTLKNFLNIIETQDAIKEIARTGYDGNINVYIGSESAFEDLKDFTIITYKQSINDKEVGTIGLIGPTRMDYKTVIPMIKYIGDTIQEKMKQGGEESGGDREES